MSHLKCHVGITIRKTIAFMIGLTGIAMVEKKLSILEKPQEHLGL